MPTTDLWRDLEEGEVILPGDRFVDFQRGWSVRIEDDIDLAECFRVGLHMPHQRRASPASQSIDIVFDGPPSHDAGRFVEVENMQGRSVNAGEWIDRGDGYWALRIAAPASPWVPCAERVPTVEDAADDPDGYVQGWHSGLKRALMGHWASISRHAGAYTHWMPLPPTPAETEEEK